MKNYLHSVELAMWLLLIAGKLVLCLCIWKKRLFFRLPWFSALIFASTTRSFVLLAVAFEASYTAYYYIFYITSYIENALAFLTLVECGRRVLPGLNLPKRKQAFGWLGTALASVLVFIVFWPLQSIVHEKKIEIFGYLAIAVVFIFIAAYSRYLGLYWSRLVAGLTMTLGLLYLVGGVVRAIAGHYPPAMGAQVREISQIANVLAVIAWIVVVLSPWGESVMTEEDLQILEAAFARIEDSLGAERVKAI